MFKNRRLLVASKHQKEKVIAQLVEKELGVETFVDPNFDSDQFGTFSGEIERIYDPISTIRQKCLSAMKLSNCDLAIASEGSFGPHPEMFFVTVNEEFLILIDKLNELEIIIREFSTDTNFNIKEVTSENEFWDFLETSGFPNHKIILRKNSSENTEVFKDINDSVLLFKKFQELLDTYGKVTLETDMRAMNNPTRMEVIKKATYKLIEKIQSTCPNCQTPGFGVTNIKIGLPCQYCQAPTKGVRSHIYTCQKCKYQVEKEFPNDKRTQDPMWCDVCNP